LLLSSDDPCWRFDQRTSDVQGSCHDDPAAMTVEDFRDLFLFDKWAVDRLLTVVVSREMAGRAAPATDHDGERRDRWNRREILV